MNKVAYLKRTQTAGNAFRSSQEKDLKSQTFTKITNQQEEEANLNKQLQTLHAKRDELKEQIQIKENEIEKKRRQIYEQERGSRWGENRNQKQNQQNSQMDKKLKMRRQPQNIQFNLAYLYQKENEMLNETVQLKNDINKMRREKEMFKKILKQLQEDWIAHHEKMLGRSQEQEKAFQSLHQEMNTIKSLRWNEAQEQRKFGKEFKSIYDKFKESKSPEHQSKSREKSRGKKEADNYKKQKHRSDSYERYSGSEEDADAEDLKYEILHINETADKKKKKILEREQKAQQNQQEQQALVDLQSEVQTYDQTLKQLYNQTKSEQIDEIVNIFVEQEEQNYGAFKYIYEQSDELEMLQKQNKLLLMEKQELENRDQKIMADQKYKQKLQFEEKLVKIKAKQEKLQEKLYEISKILKELMISIPIMFERIGCNLKEYSQLLGPKFSFKEMDEDKLLKVLGVIEIRTNDILQMQDIAQNPRHNFMKKDAKQSNFIKIDDGNNQGDNPNDELLQRILDKFKDTELSEQQFSKAQLRDIAEKHIRAGTGKKKRN
ncbi:unnamed protein product [Paramecium octaurelia]|uniref:ODAD1 central coiled coil region domain-containing protein n=1 Tax=Paramecium octaurelia TaxID=43137 RepID=A0A8S1SZP4_PAROT|nr:unnamed protein product [Paramecium octaurelia]